MTPSGPLDRPARPSRPERPISSPSPTRIRPVIHPKGPDPLYKRRTLIPILLTLGVLFCGLGGAQWMIDPEYPFSASNLLWSAILLPGLGGILLALAIVNMIEVKRRMK
ncbi:MAG TPA: hypothetical protein VL992_01105 [Tepidisphaeraceae bacterium]|nr:hypothetical protein [Tepidisphaeraceae bacterium]